jgi:hypothetical protein
MTGPARCIFTPPEPDGPSQASLLLGRDEREWFDADSA